MRRNICLILMPSENSVYKKKRPTIPPISLGVLAGYLTKNGIEVFLEDCANKVSFDDNIETQKSIFEVVFDKEAILNYLVGKNDKRLDKVAEYLLKDIDINSYEYFGCSIGADFSLMQIHTGFIVAKYLKKNTSKTVFIGGNNISYMYIFKEFYKELWNRVINEFKYIIKGPGEKVIAEIINGIEEGKCYEDFKDIKGLLKKSDDTIAANPEYMPCVIRPDWGELDLDKYKRCLPENKEEACIQIYKWPDWVSSLVYKHNEEKVKRVENKLVLPYIFNYNCPYKCAFCTQSDYDRGKVIGGKIKDVVSDIEFLKNKYDTNYFYFLNNSFNYSGKVIEEFCEEVKNRNLEIYWSDCARVNGMTYERLKLMKEAGCRKLVFGFESGSKRVLDLVEKRLDLKKLKNVLKWCKEIGIWAELEVIIGLPYEFDKEFMETYDFIKENNNNINNFWLNEYFLVPNSLIGKYPDKYNIDIIYNMNTYDGLLQWNKEKYLINGCEFTHNARLYGFNEREGREYSVIKEENQYKLNKLRVLQNKEFISVRDFFIKLNKLKGIG